MPFHEPPSLNNPQAPHPYLPTARNLPSLFPPIPSPIPNPQTALLDLIHIDHPPTITLPTSILIKLHIPLTLLIRIRIRLIDLRTLR